MNWLIYAVLGVVLTGISPVFAKSGMRKSGSYLAAAIYGTILFIAANFMVNLTGTRQALSGIGWMPFVYLLISGLTVGAIWICLLWALRLGEVIRVIPVLEASLIADLLIGIFIFHDALNWNKILILLLVTAGVVMMAMRTGGRNAKRAWLGYALGAMALTSLTLVFDRIGIYGINDYFGRFLSFGIALVAVWGAALATGGYRALRSMSFLDGIYICLSGASQGGAWYCFYNACLLGTDAGVEMVKQFDLAAAVVLGCVFMRERLSVRAILGMVFMLAGCLLLHMDLPIIPL
uniref:EamA family transporter n=1 Tax=Agathobacter sp. TaxID=2021311 RepID=UPI00405676B6